MAFKRTRQAYEADLQRQESPHVFYGTPLPPLDERVRDDGSFVPVWKQEVTDDRGRKRLHGAFTGGFSAGYFNTVGSKEGWSPSTFVSSKQKTKEGAVSARQQMAEDFMDEEDMREAEESRTLSTFETFAGFGTINDPSQRRSLIDIFRPSDESVGVKLLKRMGWKEGQGIGPHIKREANLGEGQVSQGRSHSFAPKDSTLVIFEAKTDRKGLGFDNAEVSLASKFGRTQTSVNPVSVSAADNDSDEEGADTLLTKLSSKGLGASRGRNSGVGVLNDTGSDDEDPYAMGPRISYNKTIGGGKQSKKKRPVRTHLSNPTLVKKPVLLSQKLNGLGGALRKCHDGTLPLDGFELGDEVNALAALSLQSDKYRPPSVPSDWKSSLQPPVDGGEHLEYRSTSDIAKASQHTSKTRASALGEAALPGKSVFDFISPAARNRLVEASGKSSLPPGLGEVPSGHQHEGSAQSNLQGLIPRLDQQVALLALQRSADSGEGWMPYAEDLDKRERYRRFLEIQAGMRLTDYGEELPPRAPGVNQADWVQELQEFARAAEVFKPVSGLMASRFTSASSGTAGTTSSTDPSSESLLSYKKRKPEDPQEAAAKIGMFGQLTRSAVNFYPTRLLCKRFGVSMPDIPNRTEATTFNSTPNTTPASTHPGRPHPPNLEAESVQSDRSHREEAKSSSMAQVSVATEAGGGVVDPDRNEAVEAPRPSMNLFKAVFGDSDSEDE